MDSSMSSLGAPATYCTRTMQLQFAECVKHPHVMGHGRQPLVEITIAARRFVADRPRPLDRAQPIQHGGPTALESFFLDDFPVGVQDAQRRTAPVNIQSNVLHASLLSVEASGISPMTSRCRLRGLLHSFTTIESIGLFASSLWSVRFILPLYYQTSDSQFPY